VDRVGEVAVETVAVAVEAAGGREVAEAGVVVHPEAPLLPEVEAAAVVVAARERHLLHRLTILMKTWTHLHPHQHPAVAQGKQHLPRIRIQTQTLRSK
jgi:hypothetical protein